MYAVMRAAAISNYADSAARRSRPPERNDTMAETKSPKTFVLDVSVLIHDPKATLYFKENTVLIPTLTVKNLKEESQKPGERGANARDALRNLMELFHNCPATGSRYTFPENEDELDMAIATEECVPDLDEQKAHTSSKGFWEGLAF